MKYSHPTLIKTGFRDTGLHMHVHVRLSQKDAIP